MIRPGDKLSLTPSVEGGSVIGPQPCTVVWVHPERRYYVVEFTFELGERTGRFREAFWMEQKKGDQIVNTERRNRK